MYGELVKNEKYWNELLYNVTDGNASDIDRLCRFDVFDFFFFISNHEKRIAAMKKHKK